MSLNVDAFQMALMVGIGAGGAFITQYLDIKNVKEKYGKRLDIDKKIEYLSKVIAKKQEEKGYLRERIATCEDKAIDMKGESEKDAREFIETYAKEIKRIELDIIELDSKRNDLITSSSNITRGVSPAWMYGASILIGGFLSGFLYLLDVLQNSAQLTATSLTTALGVGGAWPYVYAKFVGNEASQKIDSLLARYEGLYDVMKENISP